MAVNVTFNAWSHATGQWEISPYWLWSLVHLPADYQSTDTSVCFFLFSFRFLFLFFFSCFFLLFYSLTRAYIL
jgi:hypothetical protein